MTDESSAVVDDQNFDAWGRNRNPADWTYTSVPSVPDWLYRGYTGHEMLPQFALVNMNGRLYDPILGRMLRPDNQISDLANTQAYNMYSYCSNNPLKYTDPSGWEDKPLLMNTSIRYQSNGQGGGWVTTTSYYNDGTSISVTIYYSGGVFTGVIAQSSSGDLLPVQYGENAGLINISVNTGGTPLVIVASNLANYFNGMSSGYYVGVAKESYDNNLPASSNSNSQSGTTSTLSDAIGLTLRSATGEAELEALAAFATAASTGLLYKYSQNSSDPNQFKYVTYQKVQPDGTVYVGRSSGYGTPQQIVNERNGPGHKYSGVAVLTYFIPATKDGYGKRGDDPSYWAIRGAEEAQIMYYRAQKRSANKYRGISLNNDMRTTFLNALLEMTSDFMDGNDEEH